MKTKTTSGKVIVKSQILDESWVDKFIKRKFSKREKRMW